jgi:hypothetical protein
MNHAGRVAPFRKLLRAAFDGSSSRKPQRQLVRGMEVERPAQRPGLDERAIAPECVAHVVLRDSVNASRELQLGRGLNLRVDPTERADDLDEPFRSGAFDEEVTP